MNKKILLTLRFVLILATVLVMTYAKRGLFIFAPGYTLALIYLVSNLCLYFLPERLLSRPLATFFIFIFDIVIISLGIYFTEGVQTDFYLIYFLVIFIASVGQGIAGSIPIAIVASVIYGYLIYRANPGISFLDSKILIRIPFLFIISLVSSYWSQTTRRDLRRKDELERFTHELKKEVDRVAAKEIELRQYHETIINSVTSGVIAVTDDGIITTLNPEAERILGLNQEEALEHNIKNMEGLDAMWQQMEQSITSGTTILREEVLITVRENESVPIGISVSPITGSKGRFSGCVVIFRDLSQMRELEEKLRQAERLSYLGKMASWVAHEIRNPLTAIDGFAQLLEHAKEGKKIKQFSSEIRRGTDRINNIIDDILAFARTKRKVEYTDINLRTLIESITNNIKNVKIGISGNKTPIVKGEMESIRRLFINTINNSIEAMGENGVLQIIFSADNDYYVTEIVDNGRGISKEAMKKLFTPFFTTKQRGTGLGLSIVRKTVDEHEGRIEIESKEGEGTTCRVYLPRKGEKLKITEGRKKERQ